MKLTNTIILRRCDYNNAYNSDTRVHIIAYTFASDLYYVIAAHTISLADRNHFDSVRLSVMKRETLISAVGVHAKTRIGNIVIIMRPTRAYAVNRGQTCQYCIRYRCPHTP